ncbi:YggS family pyridoxal phosphate-dependent enzyme [Bacillus halotolerans]|uniref:YggS family pyridoxal phosphate-dependent enzyme n=1 Tax=Bacillus halotolerans TaxID=260554 RepID=UPI000750C832|nr:YggS family pyridoxal phosphate-dependent enzyme [Bacillus halotolerans]KUP37276.1 YggS family pyridoxal phosphate enzyme [Bacillus halotolerans]MBL4964885.1 YggS family pyridoxal phosphate-dependent enzyme [Bacillus halotolerans]MBL4968429.1 YggS family pyridoxal phosphate-dependent enzyme [Bacillus halotolerans]MBL4972490.1 YggS family pyridoxal phosphate-dependent enzyme [Bacillus halotolerans]MEC0251529.1 YggS family pyridoxal phosphate-dependent enzyme [Bacillus halotolerans]
MRVVDHLRHINERINEACNRSGRRSDEVTVIAVTKYVSPERAQEAVDAGIKCLGENRDAELLRKQEIMKGNPEWHFIGSLQSRKVKAVVNSVSYIHSLDRLSLAKEIEKRAEGAVQCFVQVNTSLEPSKHGMNKEEVIPFIQELSGFDNIVVAGLMTMAPLTDDQDEIRSCFRTLRELRDQVQELKQPNAPCTELSMGMSNDFEIAIEEGATYIRIGSSLVGNETGGVQQ